MNIIKQKIQPDWWLKTFAGAVLGFIFSLAAGSLILILSKAYIDSALAPQLGMWSIPWIWLFVFFLAYFIPKGWQSLFIFSIANVVAYTLLFCLRG